MTRQSLPHVRPQLPVTYEVWSAVTQPSTPVRGASGTRYMGRGVGGIPWRRVRTVGMGKILSPEEDFSRREFGRTTESESV